MAGRAIALVVLAFAAGCGGVEPVDRNASVELAASAPAHEAIRPYVASSPIRTCPQAADFEASIAQFVHGNPTHPLPARCTTLPTGSTVLLSAPGRRPRIEHLGFAVEQGALPGGAVIWSDQLSDDYMRPR
ncbi:hypothetical protein E2493_09180 [Sphingomonas parva]|uniref:Uncharacterized protein n=1 Tax=Sphingomonas parva TaxID=2555898 RepID=A0A4Y8ZSW7_9SPHN|nr:hypothetical protein [Sphingomonas parva]TFI58587.1 hypothetical protein E2493_09180 [Sphingomonas parva]